MLRKLSLLLALAFWGQQMGSHLAYGQMGILRRAAERQAEKAINKEIDEKVKEPAREGLKKDIYGDSTRFPLPENRVNATFFYETKSFKKNGKLDNEMKYGIVFGKQGENYIMNLGEKEETWFVFDYAKNASYLVNPRQKTAMKMPLVNYQKMMNKQTGKAQRLDREEGHRGTWIKTGEKKTINGFHCQEYVYTTSDGDKMDTWITQDIKVDLADNYVLGERLNELKVDRPSAATTDPNAPKGMMVQTVSYDKKSGNPSMEMTLLSFEASADEKYFDRSGFEESDVIDGLF